MEREKGGQSQPSFALRGARPRNCSPGFIHKRTNARKMTEGRSHPASVLFPKLKPAQPCNANKLVTGEKKEEMGFTTVLRNRVGTHSC